MHLINNIDAVFPNLRGNPDLVNDIPDLIYPIIGGSIQLMDIKRMRGVE
jgi:hypothetical protein